MSSIPHAFVASLLVLMFYFLAAYASKGRWRYKLPLDPLKITAESSGRASLSKTQVFFFTLIVAWVSIFWVIQEGELVKLDSTILALLGIAAGGAGLGRMAGYSRTQVTEENRAWAKLKKWIKNDFTKAPPGRTPKFSDLFTSDQGLEISRFQAVIFSVIVGFSLLFAGATACAASDFSIFVIDDSYLTLIGLSQGVYVGGKLVGPNLIAELNTKLDRVRKLELAFTNAVVNSAIWRETDEPDRNMKLAREQSAPSEYTAYMSAVLEAAEMVRHFTGNNIDQADIQPRLPPTD